MDTRTLLAIVLSIFILIASQEIISYFYPPPQKTVPPSPTESTTSTVSSAPHPAQERGAESQAGLASPPVEKVSVPAGHDITIENEVYTAIFTSLGGRLKSLRLKHYPGDAGRDSPPLEMVKEGSFREHPLVFSLEGKDSTVSDEAVLYEVNGDNIRVQGNEWGSVEFRGKTPNGTLITKTFSCSGQTYGMTLTIKVEGAPENISFAALLWS